MSHHWDEDRAGEYADAMGEEDRSMFADPGGNSALRAARKGNPRNLPCPTCKKKNRLTPEDRARGYQCDECAADEQRAAAEGEMACYHMTRTVEYCPPLFGFPSMASDRAYSCAMWAAGYARSARPDLFVISYAAEVIADNSGRFVGNGLRFATRRAAEEYAEDLMSRWTLVRSWRVVPSTDPVNR